VVFAGRFSFGCILKKISRGIRCIEYGWLRISILNSGTFKVRIRGYFEMRIPGYFNMRIGGYFAANTQVEGESAA
jgi:hypothetical protein